MIFLNVIFCLTSIGFAIVSNADQGCASEAANPKSGQILIKPGFSIDPEQPIKNLTDKDGYIYLFRGIDQPYEPGRVGLITEQQGMYSYSYNPKIAQNWTRNHVIERNGKKGADDPDYVHPENARILVSRHKLGIDPMYNKNPDVRKRVKEIEDKFRRSGVDTLKLIGEIPSHIPVSPDMGLKDLTMWNLQEINIPFDGEKIIFVVRLPKFEEILLKKREQTFTIEEFLQELTDAGQNASLDYPVNGGNVQSYLPKSKKIYERNFKGI